jgi:hypothetical protein
MEARNRDWVARFGLGHVPYRWDFASAAFRFDRVSGPVIADLCVVGTASAAEGTFLWSWANEEIPAQAKRRIEAVRRFGEEHDLPLLTTAEWRGGRIEGLEMAAVAGRILEAEGIWVDDGADLTTFFLLSGFREPAGGAEADWPFADSPNVAVITVRQILEGGRPILHVAHDEDDGGWQFLTGDTPREEDARVVALRSIRRRDPGIDALADLPLGWIAWRAAPGQPWQRARRNG